MSIASPPHLAVDELTTEGITRPTARRHRDDVGVAHEAERRRVRVAAFDTGDERAPAGQRVERAHVHAGALEVVTEEVGAADLLA
jgi:hypothetical protein